MNSTAVDESLSSMNQQFCSRENQLLQMLQQNEKSTEDIISNYCMPDYTIMDLDSAFKLTLMNFLFKKFGIKIKNIAPYNHQSLWVEHGIKSLSNILTKHLTNHGQMWPKYLPLASLAYTTFNSPNLGNYSPYELVFGRIPKLPMDLETDPDIKVSGTYKDHYTLLNKTLKYLHKLLQDFRLKRLALINKDRTGTSSNTIVEI